VVLAGFATDMCVLFTASDAYLRDLQILVPPDCSASAQGEHHNQAMEHMKRVLHVDATPSTEIDFGELLRRDDIDLNRLRGVGSQQARREDHRRGDHDKMDGGGDDEAAGDREAADAPRPRRPACRLDRRNRAFAVSHCSPATARACRPLRNP